MMRIHTLVEKGPYMRHISPGTNGYGLVPVRVEPLVPVRATNRY